MHGNKVEIKTQDYNLIQKDGVEERQEEYHKLLG